MFSIIVPLYNKEDSVCASINSILHQSLEQFEVIVVNDGSTDASTDRLATINDKRIELISQGNAGVSVARNKGIQRARYEYIAFLDADDQWHPEFLASARLLIEKYPESPWWATDYAGVSTAAEFSQYLQAEIGQPSYRTIDYFVEAKKDLPIHISSVIIRKDALLAAKLFPVGVPFAEDQEVFFQLASNGLLPMDKRKLSYYIRFAENRACQNRQLAQLPPMLQDCADIVLRNYERESRDFWKKEYLISKLLDEVTFRKTHAGQSKEALRLAWLCRATKLHRWRFYKSLLFAVLPSMLVRAIVGGTRKLDLLLP